MLRLIYYNSLGCVTVIEGIYAYAIKHSLLIIFQETSYFIIILIHYVTKVKFILYYLKNVSNNVILDPVLLEIFNQYTDQKTLVNSVPDYTLNNLTLKRLKN